MAASPTGPEPMTATTSPGWTSPYCTPISKPVGRMSDNKMPSALDSIGHRVDRGLGERDAYQLGLRAVDHVAEDPAAAFEARAEETFAAVGASSARTHTRQDHLVADGDAWRHRPQSR